jgi:beta-glucosidase
MEARIQALLGQMTLEEKARLTIGDGFWHTYGVERLGIPGIAVNDGPSGLRKPYEDNTLSENSYPATCFPAAEALSSSWDTALVEQIGIALAEECLANDVQVVLGPGINIKRTPLGGRCFEYYAEDPMLSGAMGTAFVQGVQSKGVGTSLKHFACNNQEYERMTISSEVDQRTLHEIYLAAFERVIKQAHPWTVMGAYNKVNGTYACEHPELLRQILRTEWGYDGLVISDWGAVNEKVSALSAGLDLEMPGRPGDQTDKLVQLVEDGSLAVAVLDKAAGHVLHLIFQGLEGRQPDAIFDQEAHHQLARRAAAESIILLKNQDNLLPLNPETVGSIAIIGRFAKYPRYQGAGSARVNPLQLDNAFDELQSVLSDKTSLTFSEGYTEDHSLKQAVVQDAVEAAQSADVAIIFAGLTDKEESEGFDRRHLAMSEAHNRLIEEVARVQPNIVVVLCNGSAVTMPWLDGSKAVLEAGLGGQASGGAVVDVLLGRVNPSAKLTETFASQLEDTPAYLNYPGEFGQVRYGEGLFVGYRYYEQKKIKPLFPFGFGLSYTTFEYAKIRLSQVSITDQETLEVTVSVRNTGTRAGKEIVQLYVHDVEASVVRPIKELKAFAKVSLHPGEEKDVVLTLEPRDFAFYDSSLPGWRVEAGTFELLLGPSSAQIVQRAQITVTSQPVIPTFHKWQMLKEFFAYPKAAEVMNAVIAGQGLGTEAEVASQVESALNLPLVKLVSFGLLTEEQVDGLIMILNQAVRSENN